jgi:hypothetical protein
MAVASLMRKRGRDDGLEIEMLDGPGFEEQTVEFTPWRTRSSHGASTHGAGPHDPAQPDSTAEADRRRRRWRVGVPVAAAAAMLVAAVAVATSGGGSNEAVSTEISTVPSTASSTAATLPASTVPAVTSQTSVFHFPAATAPPTAPREYPPFVPQPVSVVPNTGDPAPLAGANPFGKPTGWQLYLWDTQGGPTSMVVYDLDTGRTSAVDAVAATAATAGSPAPATGPIRAVVTTDDGALVDAGDVLRISTVADGISVSAVSTPDGPNQSGGPRIAKAFGDNMWVRTTSPSGLALLTSAGELVHTFDLAPGMELIGSGFDGYPVVRGADLHSMHLLDDGTALRYSEGITSPIESGRFAELDCSPAGNCALRLHGGLNGNTAAVSVPNDLSTIALRFSPAGDKVAIVENGSLRVMNTSSEVTVPVALPYVPSSPTYSLAPANYIALARDLLWSPEGNHLGLLTDDGITFVSADTGGAEFRILLDAANPVRYVPLALG